MAWGTHNRVLAAGVCLWLCAESTNRSNYAFEAGAPTTESVVDFEPRPLSPHFFPIEPWAMFGSAECLERPAQSAQVPTPQQSALSQFDDGVPPAALQRRLSPHFFSGEIGLTSEKPVPEVAAETPQTTSVASAPELPIRLPSVEEPVRAQSEAQPPSVPRSALQAATLQPVLSSDLPVPLEPDPPSTIELHSDAQTIANKARLESRTEAIVAAPVALPPLADATHALPQTAMIARAGDATARLAISQQPGSPEIVATERTAPQTTRFIAAVPPVPQARISVDELVLPNLAQQPSAAKRAAGTIASQSEVPHYFNGLRKSASRVPEYLNPAAPAIVAEIQPIIRIAASNPSDTRLANQPVPPVNVPQTAMKTPQHTTVVEDAPKLAPLVDESSPSNPAELPSTATRSMGAVALSQQEVPHYFNGPRKSASRVPEYLNPAAPAMLVDSQPITKSSASKLEPKPSSPTPADTRLANQPVPPVAAPAPAAAEPVRQLPRLVNLIKPSVQQPIETQAVEQPATANRSIGAVVATQPEVPHYFNGLRKPGSRIPEYLNLAAPAILADCQPVTKSAKQSLQPKPVDTRLANQSVPPAPKAVASEATKIAPRPASGGPTSDSPFRLASVAPPVVPKPALPANAALQSAAVRPAQQANHSGSDDHLVSLSTRSSTPLKPLQPAEVFSIPRPDFFAEELRLTGLDSRLPPPATTLAATEVVPLPPVAAPIDPQFRLAALQQRLPGPEAALQPAEVLPTPENPAGPRIPALDADRPITALTTDIVVTAGKLPQDVAVDKFRGDYPPWAQRPWHETAYFWDAPSLCYGGLRYEEANLERFGYGHCHLVQPFVSAAHFAGSTALLPYNIAAHPPWECIYPLGHYRPGSPNPYRKIWPDLSLTGGAGQAAAVTGLIFLIP